MSIDWDGVIVAGIFTGICLLAVGYGNQLDKERKDRIKKYCDDNGFAYTDNPESISQNYKSYHLKNDEKYNPKSLTELYLNTGYKFDIFNCGDEQTYSVGMYKNLGDFEINILNYSWSHSWTNPWWYFEQRSDHTLSNMYILCQIKCKNLTFPDFYIRKKGFMDNFKSEKSKETNIVIEKDKDFSNKYIINSSESDNTIDFFNNDNVREAFKKFDRNGFSYKANGHYLLIYRDDNNDFAVNKRVKLLETGLAILEEIKPHMTYEEKNLSKSQIKKKAKSNRKK